MALGITQAGIASFQINGRTFFIKADIRIHLGTGIREEIEVANGPAGYKQRSSTPRAELTAIKDATATLEYLASFTDATVNIRLLDGTSYTFEHAWSGGEGVMGLEENDVALTVFALTAQENNPNAAA